MRRGAGLFSVVGLRRFLVIRRHFSEEATEQHEKRVAGLVGAYLSQRPNLGTLSPAIAYVDEVFLNNGIKERISKSNLCKVGAMDMYNATFLQSHYSIVYNPLRLRSSPSKDEEQSDAVQDAVQWHQVHNDKLRAAIGRGVQVLQKQHISEIFVDPIGDAESAAEAAYLAAFFFDELKNPKRRVPQPTISCFTAHLDNDPDGFEAKSKLLAAWNRGRIMAQSQNQARRWMEMPANLFPPEVFAHEIEAAVLKALSSNSSSFSPSAPSVTVEVHDRAWLEQQNMGGVLGVAQGSKQPPFFVEVNYIGYPSRPDDHIALVGKGVTFDSGGISIKPSAGMGEMRADMGGAAVIASVVTGLIQLQSPINIRAYLPLVENMPDGNAIRPGDVLRMASGTTVQVDNTDAEGRLILADALHLAQSRSPLLLLDAATLTGAISVALGNVYTGLFCNSALHRRCLRDIWPADSGNTDAGASPTIMGCLDFCGRAKSDPFWHMPCLYGRQLREGCATADIANTTGGAFARLAGSSSAAAFLQCFVNERIPYVHLDIAGVMKTVGEDPGMRRGMTGRPTRPLIHFFDQLARKYSVPRGGRDLRHDSHSNDS